MLALLVDIYAVTFFNARSQLNQQHNEIHDIIFGYKNQTAFNTIPAKWNFSKLFPCKFSYLKFILQEKLFQFVSKILNQPANHLTLAMWTIHILTHRNFQFAFIWHLPTNQMCILLVNLCPENISKTTYKNEHDAKRRNHSGGADRRCLRQNVATVRQRRKYRKLLTVFHVNSHQIERCMTTHDANVVDSNEIFSSCRHFYR